MSQPGKAPPTGRTLATLALGALGVVYGDIGTSPLYAFKECFFGTHGFPVNEQNVLGVLSLIFWSLNFVVTFKYLSIVMRADNRGEGGILALLALARPSGTPRGLGRLLVAAGLFGSALLYGDGIITPAISVLGAVEGLSVATPALDHLVVPIAFLIILALFFVQRRGTGRRGRRVRPDHRDLVHLHRRPGRVGDHAGPVGAARDQPVLRGGVLPPRGDHRPADPGRGHPGGDGRRGAVRRHGPLRQAAHPAGLVRRGAAGAGAQLLRAGGPAAGPPGGGAQPVLLAGAGVGAVPDGGGGDGGGGGGVAGADLGGVLAHPPGGAAGVLPPGQHRPHLARPRSGRSTSRRSTTS